MCTPHDLVFRDTGVLHGAMQDGTKTVPIKRGITNDVLTQVFMNIVLDEACEEKQGGEKVALGMTVRSIPIDGYIKNPANRYWVSGHSR
jgi:hypothetical protein